MPVQETLLMMFPAVVGDLNPSVRADMVFFETPKGGAVFSVGSVAWAASLPCHGFDNNVSRLTGNVLRRFLNLEPMVLPDEARGGEAGA
jgi:N,N-dimethylformamidase